MAKEHDRIARHNLPSRFARIGKRELDILIQPIFRSMVYFLNLRESHARALALAQLVCHFGLQSKVLQYYSTVLQTSTSQLYYSSQNESQHSNYHWLLFCTNKVVCLNIAIPTSILIENSMRSSVQFSSLCSGQPRKPHIPTQICSIRIIDIPGQV